MTLATAEQTLIALPHEYIPQLANLPSGSRMLLTPNPLFIGRDEILLRLAATFKSNNKANLPIPTVAITGMGGIGKTQLATEFVYRYGQYFAGGVFWLSFTNANDIPAQIATCGGPEHLALWSVIDRVPPPSLADQLALVNAAWHSPLPRLLVFDNCEDEALVDQWRPRHGGCWILLTSRRTDWDAPLGVHTLPLGVLPRAESIALLRSFRPDLSDNDADLDEIAAELGDLPLALHLSGSFLKRYQQDITAAEYLDELRTSTVIVHESLEGARISPTKHDLSVAQTFRLSYDRLDASVRIDALALAILARTAYFAPGEPIPRDLLSATLELSSDGRHAKRHVTQGIQRLVDLGLLEEEAERAVRLHRLVAAFVRTIVPDASAQIVVEQMMLDLARDVNAEGDPTTLLALQSHLRSITHTALQRQDERAADLGNAFAYHLHLMGAYREALGHYGQALEIYQRELSPDNLKIADTLNNVGYALVGQGQYVEAQPYYEQALNICNEASASDLPLTATILDNLAAVFKAQGHMDKALESCEKALAIRERVLGPDHPETASSINNIGYALAGQNRYAEARSYYEQALDIYRRTLDSDHPYIAAALNNLGSALAGQGQYAEAQPYYEQALDICKRVLGDIHPNTARVLHKLGSALVGQGQYAEAQGYYKQALAIQERTLGSDHPDTHTTRDNLATLNDHPRNHT